jgi:hypothetical protein
MWTRSWRRLRSEEGGYALVITVLLVSIMMVLMVIALDAGQSALRRSQEGIRWTRTLTLAEAGIDRSMTLLAQDRTVASPCPLGSATACEGEGGEYQMSWSGQLDGSLVVNARGYYPSLASARLEREIEVVLEPVPTFRYALFSLDTLTVKNNAVIVGDVYSAAGVVVDQNQIICGSVIAAGGDITVGNNSEIVKEHAASGCSGKEGQVWANGSIGLGVTARVRGIAKASAPSGTTCSATSTSYQLTGGTVDGNAVACGRITSTVTPPSTSSPGTNSTPPAVESLPQFTFDVNNYPDLQCYPSTGECGPSNSSATATSEFNTYVSANKTSLTGEFAVWQTSASQSTKVLLDGITLGGDLTIITNAPIDFGNTSAITLAPGVTSASLTIVSLYIPPESTTCDSNGGECSIYGKNSITFDDGDDADPADGIAALLYTPGKMAFKNTGGTASNGEGALYAGGMDVKNGFEVTYNSRIERVLGFGIGFERTLWRELNV